jgi:hypothetical protein
MFIKIQTPDGNWDIREAKSIKFSDSPFELTPECQQRMPGHYEPMVPAPIQRILERCDIMPLQVETLPFQRDLIYEYGELSSEVGTSKFVKWSIMPLPAGVLPYLNVNLIRGGNCTENEACWEGRPLYSYAILDGTKAIVFPTKAYVCNDDGKTIAKIG